MTDNPIPTRSQLDELLAFLPVFENLQTFGRENGLDPQPDGGFIYRGIGYPSQVYRFFELASQPCFSDYDYLDKNPHEWLEDPDFVKTASLEQTITLLTFCNRAERFNEGFWLSALEKGTIQNILRRMQVLRDELS